MNIDLPPELHQAVKAVAQDRGQTLKGFVLLALRHELEAAEHEAAQRLAQHEAQQGDQ